MYNDIIEKLVERILLIALSHPEILNLDSPWDMFKVPGFDCSDLGVSLAQASCALAEAKKRNRNGNNIEWCGPGSS
jgi:hypothetical protein